MATREFVRGQCDVGDACLSYLRRSGEGPALVLIPGSWMDTEQWHETVKRLDVDLQLLLIDLRGHGGSWPPPVQGSINGFAGDVLSVIKSVGLSQFYVGGHSIGGMVALELGCLEPSGLRGIVSVEGWTHHSVRAVAFDNRVDNTLSPEQVAQLATAARKTKERWPESAVRSFLSIWRSWDGYDFLCRSHIPILEVWGDRGMSRRPNAQQLRIPERDNIELRWIENASHSLPFERPGDLAEIINGFIERTEAR